MQTPGAHTHPSIHHDLFGRSMMRPSPSALLLLRRLPLPSAAPPPRPHPSAFAPLSTASAPHQPTERVSAIVDQISRLSLLEVADLTEALRSRLGVEQMPAMAIMTPGMGATPGAAAAGAEPEEMKEEKSAFDLKLESFDAASKIKIIKEVRTFTDLGLKEAKELVEKAPTVLKTGVPKEEAEKIVEKMKEMGAKVVLE